MKRPVLHFHLSLHSGEGEPTAALTVCEVNMVDVEVWGSPKQNHLSFFFLFNSLPANLI